MNRDLCKKIPPKSIKVFGSGGSNTIIVITPDHKVYKYFITFSKIDSNTPKKYKETIQFYKNEINVQKYLTKHIVKTNLSPHIVQLQHTLECKNSPSFFFKKCPSYQSFILTKNKKPIPTDCKYMLLGHPVILKKGFLIAELEYCPITLGQIIEQSICKSNQHLEKTLNRILFQILFTLATIQKKFPYFVHHDLFMRNVLATELKASKNEYIRYTFGKYTFDLPANGFMCKISDFGLSDLNQKIHSSPLVVKSPYEDIFNILYDIYNGGNLGAQSLLSIAKQKKNKRKIQFIHTYFSRFINTKIIRTIEKKGKKNLLNWNWRQFYNIQMSKLLHVKCPSTYLKYFTKIYPTKKEHTIIQYYG